ncbi:hypothetical protein PoB_006091400 [Plakobranchus ocellatus]|uniref:Uncharacterized protein n=1 Tax=Plakobranchus ocellatus TaxID=259542 RepID=A0AAV4CRC1_9GAST|nr:hypothetical protein PoB_006091400 [Plakobranchus ocellatus]
MLSRLTIEGCLATRVSGPVPLTKVPILGSRSKSCVLTFHGLGSPIWRRVILKSHCYGCDPLLLGVEGNNNNNKSSRRPCSGSHHAVSPVPCAADVTQCQAASATDLGDAHAAVFVH